MAKARTTPKKKTPITATKARLTGAAALNRAEYTQRQSQLATLRAAGARSYDALWETVAEIIEGNEPLYRTGGGYASLGAFIAKELPGEDERSVRRNVLVATCFSPEDEARHGIDFLEEVARFVQEQSGAAVPPRAINLDRLRIPVRAKDGTRTTKKARDCTRDEVRAARKGLPGAATKKKSSPAERALRAAIQGAAALHGVTVRVSDDDVTLGKVPLASLGVLGKALAKVKLPKDEG